MNSKAFVGVSNFNESGTACQTQESIIHNDGQGIQGGCNDCHVPYEHIDENEDNESGSFHGQGASNVSDEELENMNEDDVNSEDGSDDGEEEHTKSTAPGSNDKDNEMINSEGEGESSDEDGEHDSIARNDIPIESEEEFGNIDFKSLTSSDLMKYHFPDREVAFDFYSWYARFHGFAARKDRTVHNKKDEVIQQTFVCYREGGKVPNQRPLKRAPRKKTRCGCLASCQVHIWSGNNRWYFKKLIEEHNHMLLEEKYVGLLTSHRKMTEEDVVQMMNMRKVGIRTPHIYGSFASQMGGYENVRFRKKDMYNEIDKLRRKKGSDATAALSYLQRLKRTDQALYWRHTSDEHGRLQHLFWSDGRCQYDYHVFGDVLAFDATYKKNRYSCPMVVFSGVNHHNQTIVFGCAVVSNETEETYVWVLEQFLHAMKGKVPVSVITDGDLAMRNAIRRVFASAHHRLCAWHLLRNASSNVHNTRFTQLFEECMLGDYDISEFEAKWDELVKECGVENNLWVQQLYEKKRMWATAYIRGNFFAGFRTTSRVEGLHALLGKFVNSRNNLSEFLEHYQRCLSQMRFKEIEADFESVHGEQQLQTQLNTLEKFAARVYTKEIFLMFRLVLLSATRVMVTSQKRSGSGFIYFVSKYRRPTKEWHVFFWPSTMELKCSCMRMESLGIPCDHLVAVIVYLDMTEIPKCLLLDRWTMCAKESIDRVQSVAWDPLQVCRYDALREGSKRLCKIGSKTSKDFSEVMAIFNAESEKRERQDAVVHNGNVHEEGNNEILIRNPAVVRCKGRGGSSSGGHGLMKRKLRCSACGLHGHNKLTCTRRNRQEEYGTDAQNSVTNEDVDGHASNTMDDMQ